MPFFYVIIIMQNKTIVNKKLNFAKILKLKEITP